MAKARWLSIVWELGATGGVTGRKPIYEETRDTGRRRGPPSSLQVLSSCEKELARSLGTRETGVLLRRKPGLNQSVMIEQRRGKSLL